MTEAEFKKACKKLKKKYKFHKDVLKRIEKKEGSAYEEINPNFIRTLNCDDANEVCK